MSLEIKMHGDWFLDPFVFHGRAMIINPLAQIATPTDIFFSHTFCSCSSSSSCYFDRTFPPKMAVLEVYLHIKHLLSGQVLKPPLGKGFSNVVRTTVSFRSKGIHRWLFEKNSYSLIGVKDGNMLL